MGRPPQGGGPAFRFTPNEVMEMEACLQEIDNSIPTREVICSLAEKFSGSEDRAGKVVVQPKQVLNWFQNRRYAQRVKMNKAPGKLNVTPTTRDDSAAPRAASIPVQVPVQVPVSVPAGTQMEFEAKSARDGAWYDVSTFISHRMFETSDPEVRVRFSGFSAEEDEWINVRKCVRQRSLPCEATECAAVVPGDLILCFQEGKEQALYFDAHVLDAQRRRHDVRGCRCRFLVRYDHDQSEEIVPLRKICRRPETDYRLQGLNGSKDSASVPLVNSSTDTNSSALKSRRQRKADGAATVAAVAPEIVDTGTTTLAPPANESQTMETTVVVKGENNNVAPDSATATYSIVTSEKVQGT